MSASSNKRNHKRSELGSTSSLVRIYLRFEISILYISLISYLCAGAFLFSYLEDSDQIYQLKNNDINNISNKNNILSNSNVAIQSKQIEQAKSYEELRLSSARRMWNITNQLNILYESNWTRLIIEELQVFEEETKKLSRQIKVQESDEYLDVFKGIDMAQNGSKNRRKARRSFRKWLLHSLTTISTLGK